MRPPRFFILGICLSLSLAGGVWAEPSGNFTGRGGGGAREIAAPLAAPRVGERLVYDVFWMGIPVGIGTLEVKEKTTVDGRRVFHLEATARTGAFLSKLYPVEDQVRSLVDAEKFYSIEFRKTLREGRYRADERVRYDYAARKGYYESFWNKSKKEIPLGPGGYVRDILGVFYWFRLQKAEVGRSIKTVVNSEEKNWDVELRVLSRQTKEIKGRGAFDTILVEPKTRLKGVLYRRGRALVYFTTDPRRLPVWITLKTPFGPVVGVLRAGSD
ncbi:MAG: DUF3108 domain-containing protein [Candidatus Omnitrophica bacterium]|nr:DUF3108 domain-containing protein [Candidatus Omnitrophota bacterium]